MNDFETNEEDCIYPSFVKKKETPAEENVGEYQKSLKQFSLVLVVIFILFVFEVIKRGFPAQLFRLSLSDFYVSTIILVAVFLLFHFFRQSALFKRVIRFLDRVLK